jgi:hypothetical protein
VSHRDWDPEDAGQLIARLDKLGIALTLDRGHLLAEGPSRQLERQRATLERRRRDLEAWIGGDTRKDIRRLPSGRVLELRWALSMPDPKPPHPYALGLDSSGFSTD